MSQIATIYTNLAEKSVTVNTVTPKVYGLSTIPEKVESAMLPCRILLPMGTNQPGAEGFGFVGVGSPAKVNWQILDLLLWKASEQGIGIRGDAPELVAYCGAYTDAMRTFKAPSTQSHLFNANIAPGMYEYPSGSGNWYTGVLCTLLVEEALVG